MDSGYQREQSPVKGYSLLSSAHKQRCHPKAGKKPIVSLRVTLY